MRQSACQLLETKINSALTEHISVVIAPAGIKVSAVAGKVTLMGSTTSGSLRQQAEQVVRGVAGVREIDNRITSVPSHGRAS